VLGVQLTFSGVAAVKETSLFPAYAPLPESVPNRRLDQKFGQAVGGRGVQLTFCQISDSERRHGRQDAGALVNGGAPCANAVIDKSGKQGKLRAKKCEL
jgi:hypothetical protein